MKFRKFYDDGYVNISNPGSRVQPVYKLKEDAINDWDIEKSEYPQDIQDHINSFRDSCDINLLVARFKAGDITAIPTPTSVSNVDISGIPDNYQELHDMVNSSVELYNGLPDSIKNDYTGIDDFYNNFDISKYLKNDVTEIKKDTVEPTVEG